MASKRCSTCGILFPAQAKFAKCLGCGRPTDTFYGSEEDEDWLQKAWNSYYGIYDASRQGPSPDDVGKEEGRRLMRLELAYIRARKEQE